MTARGSSEPKGPVERGPHKAEVAGSSPAPAIILAIILVLALAGCRDATGPALASPCVNAKDTFYQRYVDAVGDTLLAIKCKGPIRAPSLSSARLTPLP